VILTSSRASFSLQESRLTEVCKNKHRSRDPKKWLAIAQECSAWDATLSDGLEERKTATRRKRAKSKSKGTKRHG
jgi:hypothetical protein